MRYPSSVIVFIPQKAVEIEDCSSQITAATFPSLPIPCSLSVSTHTMPSQVYGPEHLLRLFGKLLRYLTRKNDCITLKSPFPLSDYVEIFMLGEPEFFLEDRSNPMTTDISQGVQKFLEGGRRSYATILWFLLSLRHSYEILIVVM